MQQWVNPCHADGLGHSSFSWDARGPTPHTVCLLHRGSSIRSCREADEVHARRLNPVGFLFGVSMHADAPISAYLLTGFVATLLGPVLGPMALLVFSAFIGALLAMSRTTTNTRWDGVKFLALAVAISLVLTGAAVWAVQTYTAIPGNVAMMPVAFVIAASRNSIMGLIDMAIAAAGAALSLFANRKGGGQ